MASSAIDSGDQKEGGLDLCVDDRRRVTEDEKALATSAASPGTPNLMK
jgi:hypothetical protein